MDNRRALISAISVLLVTGVFLCSCADTPISPRKDLNGVIRDQNGFPWAYLYASTGDYPVAASNFNGRFSFNSISYPVDLVTGYDNWDSRFPSKYLGIRNATFANLRYYDWQIYKNSIEIRTKHPVNPNIICIYCKFVSKDVFWQYNSQINPNDSTDEILLTIPDQASSIKGKFIYLEYSQNNNDLFPRYGIKDDSLEVREPVHYIEFRAEDLVNPDEKDINYSITGPPGGTEDYNYYNLTFPGMNSQSDLPIGNLPNSGTIKVPVLTGINYKIKISSQYIASPYWMNYSLPGEKWELADPGQNVQIIHDAVLNIAQPFNGATDIKATTDFSITDNGVKGIYMYSIYDTANSGYTSRARVFSDRKKLKLSDFESWLFKFSPNRMYFWNVVKYPNYESIDDFISTDYTEDTRYNSISASGTYSFTTAP